jgi:hypothetical protein
VGSTKSKGTDGNTQTVSKRWSFTLNGRAPPLSTQPPHSLKRRVSVSLEEACVIVEEALKANRVTQMTLEYSDGCTLTGTKGSATAVDFYSAIIKLTKKVNNA